MICAMNCVIFELQVKLASLIIQHLSDNNSLTKPAQVELTAR